MTIHVYMMPESADESSGARNFEFIHASVRPRCLAMLGRRAMLQQVACILGYLGISVMVPSADGQSGMAWARSRLVGERHHALIWGSKYPITDVCVFMGNRGHEHGKKCRSAIGVPHLLKRASSNTSCVSYTSGLTRLIAVCTP